MTIINRPFPLPRFPFPVSCLAVCVALVSAAPAGETNAFWRISQDSNGVWWAVSPARRVGDPSQPTFLRGVDHANWNGHYCEALKTNPYRDENSKRFGGDQAAWQEETLSRLKEWGFNMLGAGCSRELENRGLAHTAFLSMGQSFCSLGADHELSHFQGIPGTAMPNVFHPDWERFCDERAAKLCEPQRDNRDLFGYFFDNELDWRGRTTAAEGLYNAAMKLPPEHTARQALDAFLAASGGAGSESPSAPTAFLRLVAERYFTTIAAAIRHHDPNHLLLGCRFAGLGSAHQVVWEEAGKVCDVVTFNNYPWADLDTGEVFTSRTSGVLFSDVVAERYSWARKPLIITEWSFPALDAGLPCSGGAGQRFRTQAERTQATELFARTLLSLPFMIGYDYFMWVDEPALGISFKFPEDSNYGLVNEKGEPYPALTEMFARVNREAEALHSQGPDALRPFRQTGTTDKAVVQPPRTAADFLAVIHAQSTAIDGNRRQATFKREGDSYWLSLPSGLALSGRVGGKYLLESITCVGIEYGPFTAMLFHGDWQDIQRVTSAEWLPETSTLRVAGELRDGTKAFRITLDITPHTLPPSVRGDAPEGQGGVSHSESAEPASAFLASVVRVDNIGEAPLSGGSVWLRQYPSWASDKLTGGIRSAVNVWKQPDADLWARSSDSAWCGAATTSPLVQVFRYWISLPDKAPHPDAAFAPQPHGIVLAPGESYDPQGRMWYLAGIGTGGAEGWRAFLDAFPR